MKSSPFTLSFEKEVRMSLGDLMVFLGVFQMPCGFYVLTPFLSKYTKARLFVEFSGARSPRVKRAEKFHYGTAI